MPNQATRLRRKLLGLPTNAKELHFGNETIVVSRLGCKACTSRFIVVGNSPDVLMSWISQLLGAETGFRCFPHQTYTVWVFRSTQEANQAVNRFKDRDHIDLPPFVPQFMRTHPMYLMEVVNPPEELLRL